MRLVALPCPHDAQLSALARQYTLVRDYVSFEYDIHGQEKDAACNHPRDPSRFHTVSLRVPRVARQFRSVRGCKAQDPHLQRA